ncbi:YcxB family protein [Ruminococcus sp. XPD3002]|uniref:YcxB family protein n=1 Tax=Ruminococcus sp. XPD3002 TaxID=1452269 RepID=UPI0009199E6D|nr:YcxB family protein [Ruminococcus sp.]SFX73955.1 hypothetical protein SAMN04487832_11094 [Ruminococcus flavefaciens]HRU98449.1 YcxB family protein [Ruminococcus sp.]
MEDNIKFVKEYTIPTDVFREGYRAYQKKTIYPRNTIFMVIFLILAANFVYGAVYAPDNYLAYILIVVCLFMAFRQWYNPRKMRRSYVESFAEMGEPVYRLTVADDYAEIGTVSAEPVVEAFDEDGESHSEPLPEATRINFGIDTDILEGESYFVLINGKTAVYILPKAVFSADEQDIIRNISKS